MQLINNGNTFVCLGYNFIVERIFKTFAEMRSGKWMQAYWADSGIDIEKETNSICK